MPLKKGPTFQSDIATARWLLSAWIPRQTLMRCAGSGPAKGINCSSYLKKKKKHSRVASKCFPSRTKGGGSVGTGSISQYQILYTRMFKYTHKKRKPTVQRPNAVSNCQQPLKDTDQTMPLLH